MESEWSDKQIVKYNEHVFSNKYVYLANQNFKSICLQILLEVERTQHRGLAGPNIDIVLIVLTSNRFLTPINEEHV